MWKRIQCAVLACLMCMAFAAAAAAKGTDDAPKAMEQPKRIELVLVIDKSGSMQGLEKDTIGGFNSMIEKQKKLGINVRVTAVLFNDKTDLLYARRYIQNVRPLTEREYETGGTTALLDAVGGTILKMERSKATECGKTKVIFVIITDGLENASTKFTKQKVKEMISDKQEQDGWDFIYLGANIDAAEEAGAIGVKKANAVTYRKTKSGVRANYDAVNTYVEETAEGGGTIPAKWRAHVEEDTSK